MKAITPEFIELVRESADIATVVGEQVHLRKSGVELCGCCPFHADKTPSLFVRPGKGVFHCHGCGVGGDIFTFIQLLHKCSFRQSIEFLAARAGLKLEGFNASPELIAKVSEMKAKQQEREDFERFLNHRIEAINRKYRALGRAATHAEDCLRAGESDPYVHDLAWDALKRYIDFSNRIEREGLLDPDILRSEWEQQHVAA